MKHRTSQALYSYWNDVRGNRLAPRRFEIEPSRIASILSETFILERTGAESCRFRLAGTRLCEQFCMEFRGTDFFDGWSLDDREALQRGVQSIGQQGGALLVEFTASPEELARVATFEILVLPLVHLHATADRFLGCWCALDAPTWLGAERLVHRSIAAIEVIWPDGRPHTVVERQERQVPFLPHIRNSRLVRSERRQFRVYDGGLSKSDQQDV